MSQKEIFVSQKEAAIYASNASGVIAIRVAKSSMEQLTFVGV